MSGIAYRSMVTEGDRWLERAVDGLQNGDDVVGAGSCAAIAQAYYHRAALEKPDTLASLLAAGAAAKGAQAEPAPADDVDASIARHPAGSKRVTVNGPVPPQEQPRRVVDNPQA